MHPDIPQPAHNTESEHMKGEKIKVNREYEWATFITSSPIKKTLWSADISSSSAEFRASLTFICMFNPFQCMQI